MSKHIKIPIGLETAVADKPKLRKAMDTYVMLMHVMPNQACFRQCKPTMESVAIQCGISYDTLLRRMKMLQKYDLAYEHGRQWYIRGWDRVREFFNRDQPTEIVSTRHYFLKPTGRKLEHVLRWMSPRPVIQQMKDCFHYYMEKTAGLKEEMIEVTGSARAQAVLELQLSEFLNEGSQYKYMWKKIHADFNICTNRLRELWGMRSKGGVKYWKDKFQEQGLWQVRQRFRVLEGHITEKSRMTHLGQVHYCVDMVLLHSGTIIYGKVLEKDGPVWKIATSGYATMRVNADNVHEHQTVKRPVLIQPDEIRFLNPNVPMPVRTP